MARARPLVVAVVGPSAAGKTALLERLIPALATRGLAVGAIKHASHGFLADRPGKDSYRLYECGARAVAVISSEQLVTFTRRRPDGPEGAPLGCALEGLPRDLDVVLVEGFAREPIPRIVLVATRQELAAVPHSRGEVVSVVRVPGPRSERKPAFSAALVDRLVRELASRAAAPTRARREIPLERGRPPETAA